MSATGFQGENGLKWVHASSFHIFPNVFVLMEHNHLQLLGFQLKVWIESKHSIGTKIFSALEKAPLHV